MKTASAIAFATALFIPIAQGLESGETPAVLEQTPAPEAPAVTELNKELEALTLENKLAAERLARETQALRTEITRLKTQREAISERNALADAQRQAAAREAAMELEIEREKLAREGEISKLRAEKLANDLKALQSETTLAVTRLESEITRIETSEKRARYADSNPVYLETPLREDGILVISDRRIPLNGLITAATADFITTRIEFWNNKDRSLPIFIVINDSPGGSVMAGYRILKAMESSDAPIHVVVKSFAASMAAAITTLANESYAYPNAVLLHHQISNQPSFHRLNLTQQREFYQESERWWDRLATPVADKMGITTDEFIKEMYARSTSGDWVEFADEAQKLKWVNHIVQGMEETSITRDPDYSPAERPATRPTAVAEEQIDADGAPFMWLPRLNPKDVYFLYNPDGYYRMR